MAKIVFEKSKCIGCGSCAALCSKYWEMSEDGKARLKNGKPPLPKDRCGDKSGSDNGKEEIEIDEVDCNKEAVEACPTQCIHIER